MQMPNPSWLAIVLCLTAMSAFAGALFDDVHVLKWKKGSHGYRGSMGDFVQLADGCLLFIWISERSVSNP